MFIGNKKDQTENIMSSIILNIMTSLYICLYLTHAYLISHYRFCWKTVEYLNHKLYTTSLQYTCQIKILFWLGDITSNYMKRSLEDVEMEERRILAKILGSVKNKDGDYVLRSMWKI